MTNNNFHLLLTCERVDIVSAPSGGYQVRFCIGSRVYALIHNGLPLVYPCYIEAAESLKHAIPLGTPIGLPISF